MKSTANFRWRVSSQEATQPQPPIRKKDDLPPPQTSPATYTPHHSQNSRQHHQSHYDITLVTSNRLRYILDLLSPHDRHRHHVQHRRRRRSIRPLCEARRRERSRQCAHTRPAARKSPNLEIATRAQLAHSGGGSNEERLTITGVTGNRQRSPHHAKQHSQDLRTWRAIG